MSSFIHQIMAGFAGLFLIAVVAIVVYAVYWQAPQRRCEGRGDWWDPADRVCAKPIFLPNITHRPLKAHPGRA